MSKESLNRVRSSMIFDRLTNEFKVRKEAIFNKLVESGFSRFQLTELLGIDLFVTHNQSFHPL